MLARFRRKLCPNDYAGKGKHQPEDRDCRPGGGARDDAAIEWYRRILDADGSQRNALAGLGVLALRLGDYDLAIEVRAKLLSHEPANAHPYAVIAIAYCAKGDYDRAKENAAKARDIDPCIRLADELDRMLGGRAD
ncbi:tetratricopeptide repeat protein [Mesorhizobium sp.]|uniref:tetratricopeptide repeat protein n=1 Tax=Mesorhizobium sp. TaxID=1871066 RepID=UPI0025794BF7|nr:tetratricopeptide repeat protein [Mesorhizobium sp.]